MASHQWIEVEKRALGQWHEILGTLAGITERELSGRHGPCPSCGGKDRFRFDNNIEQPGDGGYVCGQCGSGNGISLLMKSAHINFNEAVNSIGDHLNLIPVEQYQRNQANITTFKKSTYSKEDPERAQAWVGMARLMPMCELTLRHAIGPNGLLVHGQSIVCTILNYNNELMNAAQINIDEQVSFAAGGMTYGAATIIGADTGRSIILCRDWFDAWHINLATGCQVLCCWTELNFRQVAESFKRAKPIFAACTIGSNDLNAAESAGLKVLIPSGTRNRFEDNGVFYGVERKAFCPTELLDRIEQESKQ